MHLREVPDNEVLQVIVSVDIAEVGEMVQRFIEDPDVVGIESIKPGLKINNNWFITVNYAVLDLAARQLAIAKRLFDNTGARSIPANPS